MYLEYNLTAVERNPVVLSHLASVNWPRVTLSHPQRVIEDFDMEPDKDFVLVRDGDNPDSPKLKTLTGKLSDNPQFVVSTGNRYSSVLILRLMYIELAKVLTIMTLNHLYLIPTSFNDLCKPYRVVK